VPGSTLGGIALLRFVLPTCAEEAAAATQVLGTVHHLNLVVICAVDIGPHGQKLLAHPFYAAGSLRRFLQGPFPFTAFVYLSVGIPLLGFTTRFEICFRFRGLIIFIIRFLR
jgi:hypothetical protein